MPARYLPDGAVEPTAAATLRAAPSRALVLALAIVPTGAILAWTIAIFVLPQLQFAVLAPRWAVRLEGISAASRIFGALALLAFPADTSSSRLRWVGSGLLILGISVLSSGLFGGASPNTSVYQLVSAWLVADGLFAVGLLPARPPMFTRGRLVLTLATFILLTAAVILDTNDLPVVFRGASPASPAALAQSPLRGMTAWHWALSVVLVALACAAAVGAVHGVLHGRVPLWLVPGMVIWVGAELHNSFWTAGYSPIVTTGDLLRLAFAIVILCGGVIELRRIADERTRLLAVQREHTQRLTELAVMKADFTAMVAHELVTPLAAIRVLSDILEDGSLSRDVQAQAVHGIHEQARALQRLVGDVQAIARVERSDFAVQLRPVPLGILFSGARDFGRALSGDHPLSVRMLVDVRVLADPERIGQVMRNLLANAAKYSPTGTPIELSAARDGSQVRVSVVDHGPGILAEDLSRIFEKFERGRSATEHSPPGVGVGLYLSRRILRAHGSDIAVRSVPGGGSVFSFLLREAP